MVRAMERLGSAFLGFLVPQATASAGECACDPGSRWCQSRTVECRCHSNCVTITCICPIGGCG